MHFLLIVLSAVICSLISVANAKSIAKEVENLHEDGGYYWRDYKGVIPKDALPGGKNHNGKVTYIGQVLHANQLIPARIEPEEDKVYYEWAYKENLAAKNIKILCTRHPEQFEWIATSKKEIHDLKDKHLMEGGYEEGIIVLIGRKQLEHELALGKVIFTENQSILKTTKDGVCQEHEEFEVLTYNPHAYIHKTSNEEQHSGIIEEHKPIGFECTEKALVINIFNK